MKYIKTGLYRILRWDKDTIRNYICGLPLYHRRVYFLRGNSQLEIQKTKNIDKVRHKWGGEG